jgi:hypothetical protein
MPVRNCAYFCAPGNLYILLSVNAVCEGWIEADIYCDLWRQDHCRLYPLK